MALRENKLKALAKACCILYGANLGRTANDTRPGP